MPLFRVRGRKMQMAIAQDDKCGFKTRNVIIEKNRILEAEFNVRMFNLDQFSSLNSIGGDFNLIKSAVVSNDFLFFYLPPAIYLKK